MDLIFGALRDMVKRDVEEINKLDVGQRHGCTFEFQEAPPGAVNDRFAVVRRHPNYQGATQGVFFNMYPTKVEVAAPNNETLVVIPEWDEATATCHMTVGGMKLETWQVSQKALAPFFFDG